MFKIYKIRDGVHLLLTEVAAVESVQEQQRGAVVVHLKSGTKFSIDCDEVAETEAKAAEILLAWTNCLGANGDK